MRVRAGLVGIRMHEWQVVLEVAIAMLWRRLESEQPGAAQLAVAGDIEALEELRERLGQI